MKKFRLIRSPPFFLFFRKEKIEKITGKDKEKGANHHGDSSSGAERLGAKGPAAARDLRQCLQDCGERQGRQRPVAREVSSNQQTENTDQKMKEF